MLENDHTITEITKKKLKGAGILIQKAALVVVSDNFFGTSYVLDKAETTIGREKSCVIPLADNHISGCHCRIVVSEDGHHLLEDLDSKNGTFLNTKKIKKPTQLYYHDRIVIGNTILRYYLEEKLDQKPELRP